MEGHDLNQQGKAKGKILETLSPEKAIPERELAKRLQMTDGHLRKSLERLAREGLVKKEKLESVRVGSYLVKSARVGWRKVVMD